MFLSTNVPKSFGYSIVYRFPNSEWLNDKSKMKNLDKNLDWETDALTTVPTTRVILK